MDMAAFHIHRLGLLSRAPFRFFGPDELSDDLQARLGSTEPFATSDSPSVWVYLHGLEEGAPWPPPTADFIVVGFRNRLSHRGILRPSQRALLFPLLERRMSREWKIIASIGFMGPPNVMRMAASLVADRMGRFDYGFALRDRVLLGPVERGGMRYLAALGLIVGRRI